MSRDTAIWAAFWAVFVITVLVGEWPSAVSLLAGAIIGRAL